jgi:hypothetical protein
MADRRGGRRRDDNSDSEAREDNVLDEGISESEGSGENLSEFEEDDYRHIPELDRYEDEGIDEED